jgi:hypothetical protein
MMSLRHSWGWQPPQTIYCIYMRHIQSVWAHWYAVHWCMVKALHSYNHTTWLRYLWSQNHIITSWLRLTATSDCFPHLYETYKVFEHIDMLSIDIWLLPHTVITTLLGSYVGVLDHLQSQNDVITSWLRLTSTPNYLLHPYEIYTKCFSNFLCWP